MEELVTVARFGSHIEADLAQSALQAAGVAAVVAADDGGRQSPYLDFSQGVTVLVRQEDADTARAILAGVEEH